MIAERLATREGTIFANSGFVLYYFGGEFAGKFFKLMPKRKEDELDNGRHL